MPDVTQSELLIHALLDGRLDAATADRARKRIASDEHLSELLAAFEEQRSAIADLPKFQMGDDFADRILEIGIAEAAAVPMSNPSSLRAATPASSVDWKKYAMSLAAIAALLMAMLVYQWTPRMQNTAQTVAVLETNAQSAKDSRNTLEKEDNVDVIAPAFPELEEMDAIAGDFEAAPSATERSFASEALLTPPAVAGAAMRSPSVGATAEKKSVTSDGAADALDGPALGAGAAAPGGFAFRGTAMAEPERQAQPAIDQVWLLEVNEAFTQDQLVDALTSNSISVPAELQQISGRPLAVSENSEVDGIHVAANRSQMKSALSQLSRCEAVTISAFQLPNPTSGAEENAAEKDKDESTDNMAMNRPTDAPSSISTPQRAMAQKLRGNFFASPSLSSKVPETFNELEKMMGLEVEPKIAESVAVKPSVVANETDDADAEASDQAAEMAELFPGDQLQSDELKNFLILIRNEAQPNRSNSLKK